MYNFLATSENLLLNAHQGDAGRWVASNFYTFINLPHVISARMLGVQLTRHSYILSLLGMVLLFLIFVAALVAYLMSVIRKAKETMMPSPVKSANVPREESMSRRAFVKMGGVTLAGASVFTTDAMYYEPQNLHSPKHIVRIPDLPKAFHGTRMVQISDVHHGPWFSMKHVERMIDRVNKLQPDIILLTGDYVHQSPEYIDPVIGAFTKLKPGIGSVAVLGNHDWYEGADQSRAAFEKAGIPLIDNDRVFVSSDFKIYKDPCIDGICLAGVGDFWEDLVDYRAALREVPENMPRFVLSHNPDTCHNEWLLANKPRVDLVISGHTHGGQVRIPGIGSLAMPSNYGRRYSQGLVRGPTCPVFISRGIGMTVLPLRFCCPPEIPVIELQPA